MKRFSQEELMSESVWDVVKMGGRLGNALARGAVETGKAALDIAAPELTQPIRQARDSAIRYGERISDAFMKGLKGKEKFIADKLVELGYILSKDTKYKRVSGGNYIVYAYKIISHDKKGQPVVYAPKGKKKEYPLLVNPETGYISKNITSSRNLAGSATSNKK